MSPVAQKYTKDTGKQRCVGKAARCRLEDDISSVPADVRAEALAGAGRPTWPEALQCAVAGCQIQHVDIPELVTVGFDESRRRHEDDIPSVAAHASRTHRRRPSVAILLHHGRQGIGIVFGRPVTNVWHVRTHGDFARDAPAHLDRAPRLERAMATAPDSAVAGLRFKVHSIELLHDMLDFMRDELRGAQRRCEV